MYNYLCLSESSVTLWLCISLCDLVCGGGTGGVVCGVWCVCVCVRVCSNVGWCHLWQLGSMNYGTCQEEYSSKVQVSLDSFSYKHILKL